MGVPLKWLERVNAIPETPEVHVVERPSRVLEENLAVAIRVLVIVPHLREDASAGAKSTDEPPEVPRDVDEPAAVVAEVEDELDDALRLELGEGAIERLERRLGEVAEQNIGRRAGPIP